MTSRWPTELDADGSAPPSIMLVASGDPYLMRQAMYQVQAATQLKDRGYEPTAFQVPLVGRTARITIPMTVTTPAGDNAVVYTQAEEWTTARTSDLRTWIANLREETNAPVIVASRLPSSTIGAIPEVAEFFHLQYDTLNEGAEPAAAEPEVTLLPCLKEFKWQGRQQTVCRLLWEREASQYMPWLAIGYDHPHTFEFINADRLAAMNTTEQALEAQALANLRKRQATWQPLGVDVPNSKRLHMLMCTDDFFAAERIVDADFLQQAQRLLKARGMLVGIPRRGMLLATNGEQDQHLLAAFGAVVAGQFSRGETAVISPMLFGVKDGAIVGIVEAVAEAIVPDGEPKGAPEDQDENDPNAPYVSAIVAKNDRGTEDVHLLAGGQDGMRLAKAIEAAFMALLREHMARKEFSGHIQVVVLGMTPASQRKHIPRVLEHLRGICSDLSKGDGRYRVTLTYQRPSTSSGRPEPVEGREGPLGSSEETPAAVGASAEAAPRSSGSSSGSSSGWTRVRTWVRVGVGLGLALLILSRFRSADAFPEGIDYDQQHLTKAGDWTRGGLSGVVYVPPGETLPAASLQVGVIVSREHTSASALQMWVREQTLHSGSQRLHDSGTPEESCNVGMTMAGTATRTYMSLQLCKTGDARAACVEADQTLPEDVVTSCVDNAACFSNVCDQRWHDHRDALDSLAAGFLANR